MPDLKEMLTMEEVGADTAAFIWERLADYNLSHAPGNGRVPIETVNLALKNEHGEIVGGLSASLNLTWGRCHLDILWLDERLRGVGNGLRLLSEIEAIARKKGCRMVQLNTFSFQAPHFYRRQGYQEIGRIDGFPEGHSQIFFVKWL